MNGKSPKEIKITFDSIQIIRLIGIIIAAVLGLMFLSKIITPLILIVISVFLAIALNPAVSWLAKKLRSKNRVSATGAAYVLVIGFLMAFFAYVFPPIVSQTIDFVESIPQTIQDTKNGDTAVGSFIIRHDLSDDLDKIASDFSARFSDLGGPAISTASKILSTMASIVVVLVLTFMMLIEGPSWLDKYFASLKPKRREHQKYLATQMYKVVVGFVNGQVLIAILGGIFTSIALLITSQILNVEINEVALGGIVALFALIPLIGTIIGAVIVVLSSLAVSVPLAIIMGIFFIVYQQIENVTIQPYVQSRSNTLTPLLVLIAATVGVAFSGLLGAILAIPVAACIKILIDDYFENHHHSNRSVN